MTIITQGLGSALLITQGYSSGSGVAFVAYPDPLKAQHILSGLIADADPARATRVFVGGLGDIDPTRAVQIQ